MAPKVKTTVLGGIFGAGALITLPLGSGLPATATTTTTTGVNILAAPIGQPVPGYGNGGLVRLGGLAEEAHQATTTLPNGRLLSISSNAGAEEVAVRMLRPNGAPGGGFGPNGLRTFGTPAADEAQDIVWSRHHARAYAVATSGDDTTVWAITSTGTLDAAFGESGLSTISGAAATRVAVDDWGRIVLAGSDADGNAAIWRLSPNGTPDQTFGAAGKAVGAADSGYDAVAVALDGSIFAASSADMAGQVTKLTPAGAPAAGFGSAGTASVPVSAPSEGDSSIDGVEVVLQDLHRASGPLPVVSISHTVTVPGDGEDVSTTTAEIHRLTANGTVDAAFQTDLAEPLQDPGRPYVLVDGQQIVVPGVAADGKPRVVQLDYTGAAAATFGEGGSWTAPGDLSGAASNIAVQPDGTYLVSGQPDAADAFVYAVGGTAVPKCAGKFATVVAHDRGDNLIGSMLDDVIVGGDGADTIRARGGDDTVCGGAGPDDIRGGAGDDVLRGNNGRDTIRGGSGDDTIAGGKGTDELRGGAGNDLIKGGRGPDTLRGGKGDDTLRGGKGRDVIRGGAGDDVLHGGKGRDTLYGGKGNDRLYGGPGKDKLYGGPGNNLLVQ